jgi:hypothetical protein
MGKWSQSLVSVAPDQSGQGAIGSSSHKNYRPERRLK